MGNIIEEVVKDMMPRLIGETYLRKPSESSKSRKRYGIFECAYCGKHWEVLVQNVKRGFTKSCGCKPIIYKTTHGLTHNRFYNRWKNIQARCNNPKNSSYINYGGRGITVCDEWLSATSFIDWCEGTYIEGMTLDRIDNDKGYSPENCRWTTRTIQSINQRVGKNNKSGYVGVSWNKVRGMWTIRVKVNTKYVWLGDFEDLMEAVILRDQYIIENKLPHKLNLKQGQVNE